MKRVVRLSLFALVVIAVLLVAAWVFRERLVNLIGSSPDRGAPGETALVLPDGFDSTVFASGLTGPRFMAFRADGTLFVAEAGADRVVALPDQDGDGRADRTVVVGEGYGSAHSLAFTDDGSLLVAGMETLFELEVDDEPRETARREIDELPDRRSFHAHDRRGAGRLVAAQRRIVVQRLLGDRRAAGLDPYRRCAMAATRASTCEGFAMRSASRSTPRPVRRGPPPTAAT